jgi:hypothetical protein
MIICNEIVTHIFNNNNNNNNHNNNNNNPPPLPLPVSSPPVLVTVSDLFIKHRLSHHSSSFINAGFTSINDIRLLRKDFNNLNSDILEKVSDLIKLLKSLDYVQIDEWKKPEVRRLIEILESDELLL